MRIVYAALLAAGLNGCAEVSKVEVSPRQQQRLDTVDSWVQRQFFTDRARQALSDSPLYIARIKNGLIDHHFESAGVYMGKARIVNESELEHSIESTVFHESVHHLFERGLFDVDAFKRAYTGMGEEKYPIKVKVRERLKTYNPAIMDYWNEVVAYTAEFLIYNGERASPEVERVLSACINFKLRDGFIEGLTGTRTRK